MGKLTPVFISETMPNDTFKVNTEVMLRLAPMIAPIMHRVNVYVHFFFVPMRLLWSGWEAFITGGRLGTETPPVPPNVTMSVVGSRAQELLNIKSLADYLGFPPLTDAALAAWTSRPLDLAPFAAYYKIWYDYYRDRNYVADDTILPLPSGTMATTTTIDALLKIKTRAWEHDYFTSALPWVQRGNQVLLPMTGSGNVTYLGQSNVIKTAGGPAGAGDIKSNAGGQLQDVGSNNARIENISSISFTNTQITINDLRRSVRLQEWLERNALAGSRYNESIMAHFGRKTSDSRLQRAEYLGGGKVPVKISEIVTTAFSEDDAAATVPPGNMAGHGISFGNTNRISYNCEEHGFVLGIMSVMPTSGYMQGIPKMFLGRRTFLDYPWPSFAHLGEQEVLKYEIYGTDIANYPTPPTAAPVFGYQSRYADWKYISSSSHGDFRESLDFWHLTRKFSSSPTLGETFVTFEDTLQDRVFAVSSVDTLWCYIYNSCKVVRSLPYFGTPML